MRKNRSAAVLAASFLLMAGAAITAAPGAHAGTPGATHANDRNCDFDGDGYEDVLTGAPRATVGGDGGAGYVTVQYGSSRGIGTTERTVIHQDTAGVPGGPETGDGFGKAVASGDLDGDGYDDAIVGIPGEDIAATADAGGIVILWGSAEGLSGQASDWLEAASPTADQAFGAGVAAARFDGSTPGDLLAVLNSEGFELWSFGAAGQPAKTADRVQGLTRSRALADDGRSILPKSLTTGDYDNNGYADLIVSGVSTGAEPGHGWSVFFSGQQDGLYYERDLRGGPVAASGDLNGDGYDDLATGEPHSPDDGGESMTGGLVGVYYGSADGPLGTEGADTPPQWWTQDSPGVPGTAEQGDGWGTDLSLGDTDGDGYADLAIGAPGENIGAVADAGAVWLLRGSASGLTASGNRDFNQDTENVPGVPEKLDLFGGQVRLVDPDRDGRFGLLTSAPGENTDDGVVWVFHATTGGLTATGSWTYGGSSLGAPSANAGFGATIDE